MNVDLIREAKKCKTPQELLAFVEANNMEMTEADAINCFAFLHKTNEELAEEELASASGGACYEKSGSNLLIVSDFNCCEYFRREKGESDICKNCANYVDGAFGFGSCKIRYKDNDPLA